ncbi:hypothetical protein DVH24_009878 [Malus domestica]|uniref:Uncharacterized protein n=1 Tax=Malus domestica TaxID=3750 RepID=A0A498JUG0_MALDO|nr:hypothetical protein DVH24_009878 [Malus domestica]
MECGGSYRSTASVIWSKLYSFYHFVPLSKLRSKFFVIKIYSGSKLLNWISIRDEFEIEESEDVDVEDEFGADDRICGTRRRR